MRLLISILLLLAAPAAAQTPCGPRQALLDGLAESYAERVVAQALTEDGRMLELLASADGATWTALVSAADGRTCVVASGRHFDLMRTHEGKGDDL
ncbi:MAG: hypothetical protein RIM84_26065 [Alphaproteobacteria bacterium]